MNIISHRGFWKNESEKNTLQAFQRAFAAGYGVETDVRDFNGELVISHDIPKADSIRLHELFELYKCYEMNPMLALNIKSDGLQSYLLHHLNKNGIENYFVFDMSVPDGLGYIKYGINAFTRQSEHETIPSFYSGASGVWLDEFNDHWISEAVISEHIRSNKKICIVSPELHKRSYMEEWLEYKTIETQFTNSGIMICTDFPDVAEEFFNGKN